MSWCQSAKEKLAAGDLALIRPRGNSMQGRVSDGALVTLAPPKDDALCVGAVVLVRVKGRDYLHLIKAVRGKQFLIGNNKGGVNGWVGRQAIHGIAVAIED